ncbi:MAG TPA: AsmA family protein [Candidatus Limnocylindrales bacterium]|nr:AsmA family protein [Candidatus Limnocylindrales bacterium]
MSTIVSEPIDVEPVAEPRHRWRRWFAILAALAAALWLADIGISLLIQHTSLKGRLTSHLEAAFGRPVDVRSYRFSLWDGPVLEARSVKVAEDPRFGAEYFLRAEALAVRVRWQSLLTGHLELGTLSLSRPSLNLVRDANGEWNLAEWLPRPAGGAPPATGAPQHASSSVLHFRRIEVTDGRINFKREAEKLPFAFVNVNGTVESENVDRWRLDLVATPSRAAVIVQDPGALHLLGHFGGTSSRLRPASLEVDWTGASITDVLRLLRNGDYGVRGDFDLSIAAHTEGDAWTMQGKAALARLHRWDLPLRPDNPSMNIVADAQLDAHGSRLQLTSARIETPRSNLAILGALDWTHPGSESATRLRIASANFDLADALAWARAFRSNVSDALALTGWARVDMNLAGWPPRVGTAILDVPRAQLGGTRLRSPLRAGSFSIVYDGKGIRLSPATLSFGSAANSFRVDASAKRDASEFNVQIQGGVSQVQDITSLASQLGWNLGRGWEIAGPAHCNLRWQAMRSPRWRSSVTGELDWGSATTGASLHAPFLNLPVEQIRGRADLKPSATHVTLSSAQAFGSHWNGTLDHDLGDGWRFALAAADLSASDLDRWLNPRWRESFLDRLLPFLNSRSATNASPAPVRARGKLAIDRFDLAPLSVRHLQGDLNLDGRHLEFSNVSGQFSGGTLGGTLTANLGSPPAYETSLNISALDLRALSAAFPALANTFSGSASASVMFRASGASRSDLLQSLECRGTAQLGDPAVNAIDLRNSLEAVEARPGATSFRSSTADFTCARGSVKFQKLLLVGAGGTWEVSGSVDYARNLDLRIRQLSSDVIGPRAAKSPKATDEYQLTGPLKSPQILRIAAAIREAATKR